MYAPIVQFLQDIWLQKQKNLKNVQQIFTNTNNGKRLSVHQKTVTPTSPLSIIINFLQKRVTLLIILGIICIGVIVALIVIIGKDNG